MHDPALIRGLTGRRLSRRDLLVRGAAGALALSPLAAACGGSSTKPPPHVGDPAWWKAQQSTGELVFANWPLYIDYRNWLKDRPTLNEFSRQSGVMVTYEEIIEDNAKFAGKIAPLLSKGRPTGYDIVVLTNSWQLTELVKSGWLVPLDHSQLGNFTKYASPLVKSPAYDPGNKYTVAWQSGFTGIAYDPRRTGRKITSIHDLWDPAFKGRVGMMTDLNDFGSAGLLYIGADVTNSTEDDWHRAGEQLQLQKDAGISRYYDQGYIDALERGDIWISQAWSGDVFQARASGYPHLEFVVPQEGVMHWTDNMMIPMHAANPQSAMMWMDFYYQPEVAARVAEWVNYITPVPDAKGDHRGAARRSDRRGEPARLPTARHQRPRLPRVPGPGRVRHLDRHLRVDRHEYLRAGPVRPRSTSPSDLRHFGRDGTPNRGWRHRRSGGRIVRVTTDRRSRGLARQIARGAIDGDPVRLHGAIVATLELYTIADASSYVFDTAIEGLLDRPVSRRVAEAAIRSHTTAYRHEGIAGRRRALAARREKAAAQAARG